MVEPAPFAEIVVLDAANADPVSIISNYDEWTTNERYYESSNFKLEIDDNAVGSEELEKGRFLVERGGEVAFRIEQLEREESYEEGAYRSYIIASGPEVAHLDERIALPPSGSAYDKVSTLAGESAILHYVQGHVAENATAERALPLFGTATDQARGPSISKRARYQPISEVVAEIGMSTGLGWRTVYRQGQSPRFLFEVLERTDRSNEVFIEPSMDAVDEQALLDTILGKKTYALIAGQGEGDARTTAESWSTSAEPSGWDRREMFIDARDLDDDEAAEGALDDRGDEKLEETQPAKSFTIEKAALGEFRYGRDWFLGDILMIRNRNWDVEQPMRAIAVSVSRRGATVTIDVEFERPWPTLKDRVREAFSGGTQPGSGAVDYPTDYVSATSGGKYTGTVEFHNDFKTIGPDDAVGYFRTTAGTAGVTHIGARRASDTNDRITIKLDPYNSIVEVIGGNFYVDGLIESRDPGNSGSVGNQTSSSGTSGLWRQHDDAGVERNRVYGANHFSTPQMRLEKYNSSGSLSNRVRIEEGGRVYLDYDLTVAGSKNAEIPDPDDPTIGYCYAAIEADEPGLLMRRMLVTIPRGESMVTADLPAHWSRIAKDADAMVSPVAGEATEQKDQRIMPHAAVDITLPQVTLEGVPGDYRVWVMAARADDAVADWQHVVDVPQEEEEGV